MSISVRKPTSYGAILKKVSGISGVDPNADPNAPQAARAPIGYGVFAQGLAGSLQQDASDPFFGSFAQGQLRNLADEERASVAATTDADRRYNLYGKLIDKIDVKDARGLSHVNDPYGVFNPVTVMADAAIDRDGAIAANNKTTLEGFDKGRQAGVMPTTTQVQTELGNPITGEAATGYSVIPVTNDEQAKLTTANAAMKKADADMIDANNPLKYNRKSGGSSGGDGSGGVATSIIVPIPGLGMGTFKGKDASAVQNAARNATQSPGLAQKRSLAAKHGYSVQDSGDGGIVVSNGRGGQLRYNAQGALVK